MEVQAELPENTLLHSSEKPAEAGLTERELEVLRLLAQGNTYNQIAENLVVSLNTVRFHVKGIYSKLGVTKVNQAIAEARRLRLI
ncbi:MAG TPA: helix-turn-helix transcriptional regulator [Anaerolineaceae bacterium]|nr:helix-turn-helix transcriptional regulator [Anaerolineaceae bacterium]